MTLHRLLLTVGKAPTIETTMSVEVDTDAARIVLSIDVTKNETIRLEMDKNLAEGVIALMERDLKAITDPTK